MGDYWFVCKGDSPRQHKCSIFLLVISIVIKDKVDKEVVKKNLVLLILSGIGLSINWTALFQAMKYTTISVAILSYHTAPIFITLFSAIFLKEKITGKNMVNPCK